MIICKRPLPPDGHLQEARSSGWSFAICKRPDNLDDHLQEAGSSRWSFARGRILQMIICKWPDPPDDHLQEDGSSEWSFVITCHLLDAPPNSPLSDDVIHEQPLKCNHICIETPSFPLLSRPTTVWFGNLACPPAQLTPSNCLYYIWAVHTRLPVNLRRKPNSAEIVAILIALKYFHPTSILVRSLL